MKEKKVISNTIRPNSALSQNLSNYILDLKSRGYSIIGVEQTSTSIPLNSFKFPAKTCILLGDEKRGIPVELLGMLDGCVEIPQLGVTRSLNVHVCGAICVWEFTKQNFKVSYS